jgi:hypothetical protein
MPVADQQADACDAKGADESAESGYSGYDMADYQWNRNRHSDKPDVL